MNRDESDEEGALLDPERSADLRDVGSPGYLAATTIAPDGAARFLLARQDAIGDRSVTYSAECDDVAHEQVGPLPLEYLRRLARASRTHRCGRRTKPGTPCQRAVGRLGDACGWHRDENTHTQPRRNAP